MEKIRVMLVGNQDSKIYELRDLLQDDNIAIVGISKLGDTTLEKIFSLRPGMVIFCCGDDYDMSIKTAENIYTEMSGCSTLLLCERIDINIIEKAMFAGVKSVLQLPIEKNELLENIKAAFQLETERLQNSRTLPVGMQSKVITVFGSKGGIGKTTIAVNLAVVLAQMGKKIAVVDTDLQFGDVNVFFDVESKNTIAEVSQSKEASDINAIKRMTVMHHSGVNILCAPKSPEYSEYVTPKIIESVITTMRPYYDYVIVDTTPLFNDATVVAIENSNLVLMVTGTDISSLRNTKTSLDILKSLQQTDKLEFVINKISSGIISIKDVLLVLEKPVKNQISYDFKTALDSHNKGIPIVLGYPRTVIAKELTQLAENVVKVIEKSS